MAKVATIHSKVGMNVCITSNTANPGAVPLSMDKNATHSIYKETLCCVKVLPGWHFLQSEPAHPSASSLLLQGFHWSMEALRPPSPPPLYPSTKHPPSVRSHPVKSHYVTALMHRLLMLAFALCESDHNSVSTFKCAASHLSAIWRFGDDFRSHPIGCPH